MEEEEGTEERRIQQFLYCAASILPGMCWGKGQPARQAEDNGPAPRQEAKPSIHCEQKQKPLVAAG